MSLISKVWNIVFYQIISTNENPQLIITKIRTEKPTKNKNKEEEEEIKERWFLTLKELLGYWEILKY